MGCGQSKSTQSHGKVSLQENGSESASIKQLPPLIQISSTSPSLPRRSPSPSPAIKEPVTLDSDIPSPVDLDDDESALMAAVVRGLVRGAMGAGTPSPAASVRKSRSSRSGSISSSLPPSPLAPSIGRASPYETSRGSQSSLPLSSRQVSEHSLVHNEVTEADLIIPEGPSADSITARGHVSIPERRKRRHSRSHAGMNYFQTRNQDLSSQSLDGQTSEPDSFSENLVSY